MISITISEIKEKIIILLQRDIRFYEVELLPAYSGVQGKIPTDKAILTVGIYSIEAVPSGLGSYMGIYENQPIAGLFSEVTLQFDCYLPQNQPIATWDSLFEGLCEVLLGEELGATKIWCENPVPKDNMLATHTSAKAVLQVPFTTTKTIQPIKEAVITYRKED